MKSTASSDKGVPPSRRSHFGHRRAANHDTAHASAEENTGDGNTPKMVATEPELADLLSRLRAAKSFAYDSEFIGELTYLPQLCLIQVATLHEVALIDPLAGLDVKPFWELVADPSVEKIVHAGEQDVEPVFRHVGRAPENMFDTQIAAGFVSLPYPLALSKLVFEIVGAKLGKSLTFSHWDQRPLSSHQLRYAADDVRYLPAVGAELAKRLEAAGNLAWAKEESGGLSIRGVYQFDAEKSFLRVRGSNTLAPTGLGILRELAIWRDAAARAQDVPPRTLLKDEIMLDLARSPVKTVEKLSRVRGLPRPVEAQHGAAIVEATSRALALPPANLPSHRHYEPGPRERFMADAIWSAGQAWCFGRGIDPNLVTSRQEIGELCRAIGQSEAIEGLAIMQGWRRAALGQKILDMLGGKFDFSLKWKDGLCAIEGE